MTGLSYGDQEWTKRKIEEGDISGGMASGHSGTSIFDPVLCELAYRWFCPPGGLVLDPFAGGSVRGIVASELGRRYIGVDLRPEQIEANRDQAHIATGPAPDWRVGDSRKIGTICKGVEADFIFSCPPYADLEIYSDDPADLSTLDYPAFREAYFEIIRESCALLKPDRFAVFVVGDVRGPGGMYYGLPEDTVLAFREAGLGKYNEAILVTAIGSLPIRAAKQFERSRKLGKTHQNVLVFCKGDPVKATAAVGPVDYGKGEDEETGAEPDPDSVLPPPLKTEPEPAAQPNPKKGPEPQPEPGRALGIPGAGAQPPGLEGPRVPVKVSAKSMRLEFQGCDPDYIREVCHGRCCWIESNPKGTTIRLEPDQVEAIEARGCEVDDQSIMVTVDKRCVFQKSGDDQGLCGLHGTGDKPRSCIQSPLMITAKDTLVIRNRYKALKCYKAEPRLPVYRAFSAAVTLLFGEVEADRITQHLDAGGGDLIVWMQEDRYFFNREVKELWTNQQTKKAAIEGPTDLELGRATPIQESDGIYLKRDDQWNWSDCWGAKARAGLSMAAAAFGIVTCGSRHSRQIKEMALVGAALGIPVRAHCPSGELGPTLIEARQAGAEMIQHSPGYNTVITARARDDAKARGWRFIPLGMADELAVELAAAQVVKIPAGVTRVVVPVGSGTNLAGVLRGLDRLKADIPVLGITVGGSPVKILDKFAPRDWRERCELRKSGSDYGKAISAAVGEVELDGQYEAKARQFLELGDLLWIIGGP